MSLSIQFLLNRLQLSRGICTILLLHFIANCLGREGEGEGGGGGGGGVLAEWGKRMGGRNIRLGNKRKRKRGWEKENQGLKQEGYLAKGGGRGVGLID